MSDPVSSSLRTLAHYLVKEQQLWLFGALSGDRYVRTDHLRKGDEGVVAQAVLTEAGPPTASAKGYIGTGSNRFRVEHVVVYDDIPGAWLCVGCMEQGGFHVSKHNFTGTLRLDDAG